MAKKIGVLTAGGDCPGLNAAIRGLGKAAQRNYGMKLIGFIDGFRGLINNDSTELGWKELADLLSRGGTILGTSRDKPHRILEKGKTVDKTDQIVETYKKHKLECLVCLGGGGTVKNAFQLHKKGLNVITLPKTIDNDIAGTDISFGFDTALEIATDAIDRLHSTAHSHHRIIVVEIMGHNSGWLALGAGVAGGADVILIPEIPYSIESAAKAINRRKEKGKKFSIVSVAEGACSLDEAEAIEKVKSKLRPLSNSDDDYYKLKDKLRLLKERRGFHTARLAEQLEKLTGLESRLTILGHVQRGGSPSAADRLLATRLGTGAADVIHRGQYGVMLSVQGDELEPVALEKIVGKKKFVPSDHPWVESAKSVGTSFGDPADLKKG